MAMGILVTAGRSGTAGRRRCRRGGHDRRPTVPTYQVAGTIAVAASGDLVDRLDASGRAVGDHSGEGASAR